MYAKGTKGRRLIRLAALAFCAAAAQRAVTDSFGQPYRDSKPEVFIYCANESSPTEEEQANYEIVIGWLRSSDQEKLHKLVDSFEWDMDRFPKAVDNEVAVFRSRLPQLGRSAGAAVFTNRSVREGRYWLYRCGDAGFEERSIRVPEQENFILAANPLSDPDTLRLALEEVARQFDPAEHEFVLVTKSHGSLEMALTPRLVVRAEDTSREELLALVDEEIPEHERPAWARRLGITRQECFSILEEAGQRHRMRFSLVFTESCQGVLEQELKIRLPNNVRRMYTTGTQYAAYQNLDYERVFDRCAAGLTLAEAMDEQLAERFPGIIHTPLWLRWHFYLYWLPVLLWLGWLAARHLRKREESEAADAAG